MRISVVIPTADRGSALSRSMDSVLRQSLPAHEIILVDNGLAEANGPWPAVVKRIRTEPRIGPGRARNIGATAAVGEFVAFLDDDDRWEPDYLQKVLEAIETHSPDAVLGRLRRETESGFSRDYKLFPEGADKQRRVYYSNPGFGGQNLTIRRDVFLAIGGFDETMRSSEDRDLLARLLQDGRRLVPQPDAVAVLCDHQGTRARNALVQGNRQFISRHWKAMNPGELARSVIILLKRQIVSWTRR
jgi:glycosyltransferase involved in cell wall biosynthesis